MSEPFRLRTPPPYADYLHDLTWPDALDHCDYIVRRGQGYSDDDLAREAFLVLRYLTWLTREVHGLIHQLRERGIDVD